MNEVLKQLIDKAHGPMNVGRIIVRNGRDGLLTIEIQDDAGWVLHELGPVKVLPGDTLTICFPKEHS